MKWNISAKAAVAVQLLLVKHRIRIVDFALFWGFVEKVRHWGNASESQSASGPLPPTKSTEKGVMSSAPGLGCRAEPCPRKGENCPEPACTTGCRSLLFFLFVCLGGYVLVLSLLLLAKESYQLGSQVRMLRNKRLIGVTISPPFSWSHSLLF